ncbi:hypothetical protein PoB_003447400 [Plakobranchus ocellatus]|uniref:Uncharacterized protein n=1 Tax=Plakobranchus ocellatus TaxID=259542 RepID=A0AAV4AJR0_9GAST|nr:hypothetical protein PoB_003447400 [Plakobranchus ocellatus]
MLAENRSCYSNILSMESSGRCDLHFKPTPDNPGRGEREKGDRTGAEMKIERLKVSPYCSRINSSAVRTIVLAVDKHDFYPIITIVTMWKQVSAVPTANKPNPIQKMKTKR